MARRDLDEGENRQHLRAWQDRHQSPRHGVPAGARGRERGDRMEAHARKARDRQAPRRDLPASPTGGPARGRHGAAGAARRPDARWQRGWSASAQPAAVGVMGGDAGPTAGTGQSPISTPGGSIFGDGGATTLVHLAASAVGASVGANAPRLDLGGIGGGRQRRGERAEADLGGIGGGRQRRGERAEADLGGIGGGRQRRGERAETDLGGIGGRRQRRGETRPGGGPWRHLEGASAGANAA